MLKYLVIACAAVGGFSTALAQPLAAAPDDSEMGSSIDCDDANGLAFGDGHWFLASADRIYRLDAEFGGSSSDADVGFSSNSQFGQASDQECGHVGDIDYYEGEIYVPLNGCSNSQQLIAVYDGSLNLLRWATLDPEFGPKAAWVSVNPIDEDFMYLPCGAELCGYSREFRTGATLQSQRTIYFQDHPDDILSNFWDQGLDFAPNGVLYWVMDDAVTEYSDKTGFWVYALDHSQLREDGWTVAVVLEGAEVVVSYDPDWAFGRQGELQGIDVTTITEAEGGLTAGDIHLLFLNNDLNEDNITVYHFPASDWDGDGVEDTADNCVMDPNPNQEDLDEDGIGDGCDLSCDLDAATSGDLNGNFIADLCESLFIEPPDILQIWELKDIATGPSTFFAPYDLAASKQVTPRFSNDSGRAFLPLGFALTAGGAPGFSSVTEVQLVTSGEVAWPVLTHLTAPATHGETVTVDTSGILFATVDSSGTVIGTNETSLPIGKHCVRARSLPVPPAGWVEEASPWSELSNEDGYDVEIMEPEPWAEPVPPVLDPSTVEFQVAPTGGGGFVIQLTATVWDVNNDPMYFAASAVPSTIGEVPIQEDMTYLEPASDNQVRSGDLRRLAIAEVSVWSPDPIGYEYTVMVQVCEDPELTICSSAFSQTVSFVGGSLPSELDVIVPTNVLTGPRGESAPCPVSGPVSLTGGHPGFGPAGGLPNVYGIGCPPTPMNHQGSWSSAASGAIAAPTGASCTATGEDLCGNCIIDSGETCDQGILNGQGWCSGTCRLKVVGPPQ